MSVWQLSVSIALRGQKLVMMCTSGWGFVLQTKRRFGSGCSRFCDKLSRFLYPNGKCQHGKKPSTCLFPFNDFRWKPRVQGPNNPPSTATLLECVVDFELTTGHSLAIVKAEVLSWTEKAKRLAYYLKVLARRTSSSGTGSR